MVTVFRAHGLRFVIFSDDHEPAHVHVFGDGHAKFNLAGVDESVEMIWVEGMKKGDLRRAMKAVEERRAELLARWRDIHG